jgi:hypothetical protein
MGSLWWRPFNTTKRKRKMNNHLNLLDTGNGNTKIAKTNRGGLYRVASLSLMPDRILCPGSKAAGCFEGCLKSSGRGRFDNVAAGRQWRSDLWHQDQGQFLGRLKNELGNFSKLCQKNGITPAARLNTISDIPWEKFGIPDLFPEIYFYDYTKRAARLNKTPANYTLMFSYSGRAQYANQVQIALGAGVPIAAVFRDTLPGSFMGRPVIDGDKSDLINSKAGPVIIGLKAKGSLAKADQSGFVIDAERIPALVVAA